MITELLNAKHVSLHTLLIASDYLFFVCCEQLMYVHTVIN